jgi:ribosomal protein L19E
MDRREGRWDGGDSADLVIAVARQIQRERMTASARAREAAAAAAAVARTGAGGATGATSSRALRRVAYRALRAVRRPLAAGEG